LELAPTLHPPPPCFCRRFPPISFFPATSERFRTFQFLPRGWLSPLRFFFLTTSFLPFSNPLRAHHRFRSFFSCLCECVLFCDMTCPPPPGFPRTFPPPYRPPLLFYLLFVFVTKRLMYQQVPRIFPPTPFFGFKTPFLVPTQI